MKATDMVSLVCVTSHNHIPSMMTRQQASNAIREWWQARQDVLFGGPDADNARQYLRLGTWAFNTELADADGGSVARAAVAVEHVVGMYIAEIATVPSIQERAIKAMEKVVPIMEKEADEIQQGEEWKNKQNEEEDE